MAQATLSVRLNPTDKYYFEEFCKSAGMNVSTAINMFVKAVIKRQEIPFAITGDPFHSEENMERLRRNAKEMEETGGTVHELNLDD